MPSRTIDSCGLGVVFQQPARKRLISYLLSELKLGRSPSHTGGHTGRGNIRNLHGSDYYSWINSKRIHRNGWSKGKMRKPEKYAEYATTKLDRINLRPAIRQLLDEIIKVCTT